MHTSRSLAILPAVAFALSLVPPAAGQSFNIDFGPAESAPPSGYAAAGVPGTWNAIGVLPPFERAPLVGLDGQPGVAQIYMFGGTILMTVDEPGTAGDDEALMDDMLIGYCDPVDVCIWVENLVEGDYEVLTYGLTPGEPTRLCPVRVDFGTPGPTDVGGAWPGGHAETVTYARHLVTPTNQRIALHSGTYNGFFQAGINGVQIRKVGAVTVDPGEPAGATRILRALPNPAAAAQRIAFTLARPLPDGRLEILDPAGRVRWQSALAGRPAGPQEVRWDGRDAGGRRLLAGLYFVRIAGGDPAGTPRVHKLVRLD
jgi:hypothetical protein